jgi:hypothetical protein
MIKLLSWIKTHIPLDIMLSQANLYPIFMLFIDLIDKIM